MLPIVFVFRAPLFNLLASILGENNTGIQTNAFMLYAFFVLIYIFCLLFEDRENREQIGYRNLFYAACICQAFSSVSNVAMRVGYYFMIYLVLLFPEVILTKNDQKLEMQKGKTTVKSYNDAIIMYIAVVVFFTCWGLYSLSNSTWAETNPHSFFWQ